MLASAITRAMTDFPFAIVGFDLDGTLVDSTGDLANAVNHVLGSIGREPLPRAAIAAMIGGGARRMLRLALEASGGTPETFEALHSRLLEYYAVHIAVETRLFPGALAAIEALRLRGVRIALITNKLEALSRKLLDALGATDRFDLILGGDSLGSGTAKPSPAMLHAMVERLGGGRAVLVGDSRFDIAAARAAGMACVAVAFGADDAHALGADAVIDRFDALVPTLETLGQTGV